MDSGNTQTPTEAPKQWDMSPGGVPQSRNVREVFLQVQDYLEDSGEDFLADILRLVSPREHNMPGVTAYTVLEDGWAEVYLNLDFMNSLDSLRDQAFVLAHELGHILFGDLVKIQTMRRLKKKPHEKQHIAQLANTCGDAVINDYLDRYYGLTIADFPAVRGQELIEEDCADLVMEEVMAKLPPEQQECPAPGGLMIVMSGCGSGEHSVAGDSAADFYEQIASVAAEHGMEELSEAMKEAAKDAAEEASKGEGGKEAGSGEVMTGGFIADTSIPADWDSLIKYMVRIFAKRRGRFLANSGSLRSSFDRPRTSAIHLWPKYMVPRDASYQGRGNNNTYVKPRIMVAIDSSGSISEAMLKRFLGVADKLDSRKIDLTCVTFSDTVHDYDVNKPSSGQRIARGGTSFRAVVARARQIGMENIDAVIMITDGYSSFPSGMTQDELDKYLLVLDPYDESSHKSFKKTNFNTFFGSRVRR